MKDYLNLGCKACVVHRRGWRIEVPHKKYFIVIIYESDSRLLGYIPKEALCRSFRVVLAGGETLCVEEHLC